MDLGFFKRSKMGFAVWIIAPAVLVAAVHYASRAYVERLEVELTRQTTMLGMVPGMKARFEAARAAICDCATDIPGGEDPVKVLGSALRVLASTNGLTVHGLSMNGLQEESGECVSVVQADLSGDGDLTCMVRLLDELPRASLLASMDSVRLTYLEGQSESVYSADFGLRVYQVDATNGPPAPAKTAPMTADSYAALATRMEQLTAAVGRSLAEDRPRLGPGDWLALAAPPPPEPAPASAEESEPPPEPETPVEQALVLKGVLRNGAARYAYINDRVVGLNEDVGPYQVVGILPDYVVLRDQEGKNRRVQIFEEIMP